MQLFIMRHGEASFTASSDQQRSLTPQGQLEANLMAKWLKRMKINFEHVLVSPYLRAQQTANIIFPVINHQQQTTTLDIITPDGNASNVHDYIDGLSQSENIEKLLIVSHMPLVSYLVSALTFDHQSPIFQTAAIAQIDYDVQRMKGRLVRLISPIDLC